LNGGRKKFVFALTLWFIGNDGYQEEGKTNRKDDGFCLAYSFALRVFENRFSIFHFAAFDSSTAKSHQFSY